MGYGGGGGGGGGSGGGGGGGGASGYGAGGSGSGASGGSGYRRVGDDRTANLKVDNITNRDGSSGTEVDGIVEVNTTAHFVPPVGNTAERGSRGRGLFFGGNNPTYYNEIQYITIATLGNTSDFGDMSRPQLGVAGASSSTRMVFAGGYGNPLSGDGFKNLIEYITISSTGNSFDFGDLSEVKNSAMPASDGVRGIFSGGANPAEQKDIEFVQIASKGNSSNFGEITGKTTRGGTSGCNTTRGLIIAGTAPAANNVIEYITMATSGNSLDFGDTTTSDGSPNGISSNTTRAIRFTADYSTTTARIDYVTIASLGDAVDFGDQNVDGFNGSGVCASPTRAVAGGGFNSSANKNYMSYVEINTLGNAQDFGDLIRVISSTSGGSDSHGGLG